MTTKSVPEDKLAEKLTDAGIPFQREYKFATAIKRKWRADFFILPDLLIEVEGGLFLRGRHSRGAGYTADIEKYNAATLLGFRLLRFAPSHIRQRYAIDTIQAALDDQGGK